MPHRVLNGIRRTGSRDRWENARVRAPMAMVAATALIALVGCGSSKPAYCSDRTKLEDSIKGLTSLNLSSGLSGLKSQLTTIENDATTLVNSAKSDFPSETSAVKTSVEHARDRGQGSSVERPRRRRSPRPPALRQAWRARSRASSTPASRNAAEFGCKDCLWIILGLTIAGGPRWLIRGASGWRSSSRRSVWSRVPGQAGEGF